VKAFRCIHETEVLMRRVSFLLVLLLVLAACTTVEDDSDTEVEEPEATPIEVVDEEPPDPTPTPTEEPTPEPSPTPTPTPEPEPEEDEISIDLDAFVDEVVQNVVELRGLEMLEELQFGIMTREELAAMLEEEIEIEQVEIDLYWIFRLFDNRDIDLERLMIDAQAADIYGFYDTETKETYLIAEDDELRAMEEVFLAHEITHALQDQHFDLERLDEFGSDYDGATAFLAMVEGDAVLTQELYAQTYFDSERQMAYVQEAMSAIQNEDANAALDALPRYVIESLSFPYSAGPMFMLQAYDGDLNSLDEYLQNPPASTQQVMNADAYIRGDIQDPVPLELPEMLDRLGDDWNLYDEGTLGVFDLTIMLEENGVPDPEAGLEWWNGSIFAMYENGEEVVGILMSEWETEEAAADFEAMLVETMATYSEEDGVWMGDGRFHTITSEGTTVILKSASDEQALLNVAELN
jgi:hypothetical protein